MIKIFTFLVGPANPLTPDVSVAVSAVSNAVSQAASNVSNAASDVVSSQPATSILGSLSTLLFPVLLIVVFYLFLIRPQKKKEKEATNLRNSIQVGDEITTIGGVIGRVVMIKDPDQLVIETGADKTKLRLMRWAVQTKNTISSDK